jgi:4-carboxymuconolactone decarboxylase
MKIVPMAAIAFALITLHSPLHAASKQSAAAPAAMKDADAKQVCESGGPSAVAMVADRMPDIPADKLTDEQKKVVAEFAAARGNERGGNLFGPYVALGRDPEVLRYTEQLGNYLQFKSVLPPKIRQFIMAITARQWSQEYMWGVHCPQSLKNGVSTETVKALAEGRRPTGMTEDEAITYDFMDELHRNQSVSDKTYSMALSKFGEQGIIDMIGLNGYYTYIAMVLNATRHPVNEGSKPGLPVFPH